MQATPPHSKLRVYLVEDATTVRRKIALAFSAIANVLVVGEADDADIAMSTIAASDADVAVIDLRLASSNGLELIGWLSRELPSIVTLVLTNHSGAAFRAACQRAGADLFFDKTAEFDAACGAIKALANTRMPVTR